MIGPTERRIHDELAALLQRFSDEDGIRVNRLNVEWLDASSVKAEKFLILHIALETTTRPE